MANFRPAGLSDDDTDSDDDYGYFEKLNRNQNYVSQIENVKQKTETKLQEAIINGNVENVADIIHIDLKDDVNTKLESGWTPLLHACFHAQEEIVQFLLDKGADPNVHADSLMPVTMACANTSANETTVFNIVSNLIKHESLLNIGDKYGVTPLMKATISGRSSVVKLIIDNKVNIEMRDSQGWTAVFWAIHHNQPKCLEILLSTGARLKIFDMSNRTPETIALTHDYDEVQEVISRYTKKSDKNNEDNDKKELNKQTSDCLSRWQDYYPGLRDENRPKYSHEIFNLLYGMNCDHLSIIFEEKPIDLRKFLLLEDEDLLKLGIDMPFERQRLKHGLREFHKRGWKVNSVAGLQTRKDNAFSIIDCVNILGNHLQQLYILESTLAYILRGYSRIQNQIKFEPPDSPTIQKLQSAAKKMTGNINNIRREINSMKKIHAKLSKENLKPVDLITEKTAKEVALGLFTDLVVISTLGFLLYQAKKFVTNMLHK
ncbi:ankyrin repeat, SAM and basic leucine zipper domain-containing protein 1 [Vanessa atalanta]|uniref:ankyrin repeat, SAM and basic leucine zipper domain-containing protein 1 n=1 Tax=Vanessa atalanta TaxID=42275 RepID=UPI001FCD935F|nr:ankyrin repeat, SAM and basic leucine zipper domain-containing protein 1 [Vanessa atalanta]